MANQSIYSDRWIDLVFENRNKEYGAYQLRQENPATTLKALAIGTILMLALISTPIILNHFSSQANPIIVDKPFAIPVVISSVIDPIKPQPTKKDILPLTKTEKKETKKEVKKENLIDPTVTNAEKAKTDVATNVEAQQNQTSTTEGGTLGGNTNGVEGGTGTDSQTNEGTDTPDKGTHVAAVLDKQPAFPGGMNKFYSYVAQNFNAPETQLSNTIKVYVSFVIERDGSMTDIKVLRNPGYGLDKEAIRVLKNLKTKWSPGILNGKPVRTAYNLPIVVERK